MKLAACLIVKATADEAKHLERALESIHTYVDEIHLYINYKGQKPHQSILKLAHQYKCFTEIQEWTYFGDARNKNFAMTDADWIFWMDTDDTVDNAETLRKVCKATPKHISGVYMPYDYQHDDFGNVTVKHYVARLVRNDGSFRWSDKKLHESLEPVRRCGKAMNTEVTIVHHADETRRDQSLRRNITLLEEELRGEGNTPDPRTLFYLGSAYIDAGRLDEAKELLTTYLQLSGYAEERAQAWLHLGTIYEYEQDEANQRKCYMQALHENPKAPEAYVELATLEITNQLYQKAVTWLKIALDRKTDPMEAVNQSEETTYRAHMLLSECYLNIGGSQLEKALEHAQKALDMRPDDNTQTQYELITKILRHRDMSSGVVLAMKQLEIEKGDVMKLYDSLPAEMKDNPAVLRLKKKHHKSVKWPKNSIVFFVGDSALGEWGPWSLAEGTGGSEEATIRISKHLTDMGYDVTVFATPGVRAGDYEGVHWRNYWEMTMKDRFDIFIAWRSPWFFDAKIKARKKYLWLHDVMEKSEFTKERIKNIDKVIVLSEYHRTLFPMIPDKKIMFSANGIDPKEFEAEDGKHKRDPKRIIYMSSHTRGLEYLYQIWNYVKEKVPDATLDAYYGWESYVAVNRDNPERMAWKDKMTTWAEKLEGVTDHGRVGQDEIVKIIQQSGVWAYPCGFPEISCITAMKAQAGGAIPVTSDFAALNETVQYGIKLPIAKPNPDIEIGSWDEQELSHYAEQLINVLNNPPSEEERTTMMEGVRNNMSWRKVAEGWNREFTE